MLQYFEVVGAPGLLHFHCDRMRANLSPDSCAEMWRKGNRENDGGRCTCRLCPIGAEHAGEANASTSSLHGIKVCARCHNGATRLIGGMVCVSCKNREYEFLRGTNAKGTKPVKLKCLSRRRLRYLSGRTPSTLLLTNSLDMDELIVATLRDSDERVRFGFGSTAPAAIKQLRLF